ncbi:hypothetical protein J6590_044946 [Homalodisca vitripennis]|nr:hypothetical protein J6590_044946 [Homalodisca vitripennis]
MATVSHLANEDLVSHSIPCVANTMADCEIHPSQRRRQKAFPKKFRVTSPEGLAGNPEIFVFDDNKTSSESSDPGYPRCFGSYYPYISGFTFEAEEVTK